MLKRFLFVFLLLVFAISPLSPIAQNPVIASDGEVCGMDGETYASATAAEEAGVDISYDFACTEETSEYNLYEETNRVRFSGMLVEVGSTDIPTTLIVRDNETGEDYTIEVTEETALGQMRGQETKLSDWIPGDQIKIVGKKNENTENIEAEILVNLSINIQKNEGINGWITEINKETNEIKYQWANVEQTISYNDTTRFVVGGINPASIDNLSINDRIRGRLVTDNAEGSLAKIIIVLRRGEDLFMKIRTFRPNATLVRLDSTVIPTTIQIKIEETPGLKEGDVNNLIGTEGDLVTVNITEDTKIVRKYFGQTNLDEFAVGDKISIVGRANDDGTMDAKVLKNNSVWKTTLQGHAGVVTEVNEEKNYLMLNWMPYKHITRKQLKEKLDDTEVVAQIAEGPTGRQERETANEIAKKLEEKKKKQEEKIQKAQEKLAEKLRNAREKIVGSIKRIIQNKKVKIERIRTRVRLQDLIKRETEQEMKVEISDKTKIIVGTNEEATLSDIENGDKIRVRGTRYEEEGKIIADTIVVVSSIPEIEEDMETMLDEINENVSSIVTDENQNTSTDTEEVEEDEEETECDDDCDEDDNESDEDNDSIDEENEEEVV